MKVHKRKDGKYSFIGMTEEEVSVIRSLIGLTSIGLNGAESCLYKKLVDLPRISYVNAESKKYVVLTREQ